GAAAAWWPAAWLCGGEPGRDLCGDAPARDGATNTRCQKCDKNRELNTIGDRNNLTCALPAVVSFGRSTLFICILYMIIYDAYKHLCLCRYRTPPSLSTCLR